MDREVRLHAQQYTSIPACRSLSSDYFQATHASLLVFARGLSVTIVVSHDKLCRSCTDELESADFSLRVCMILLHHTRAKSLHIAAAPWRARL